MGQSVYLGIDILKSKHFAPLDGKRVGLYTNASGVDSHLMSTYNILWQAEHVNLVTLFTPEHGLSASAQDGEYINSTTDPKTGIPIYSLYGESLEPNQEMMSQVDVIVVDIQDVGIRYYTFTWTMTYLLEACGKYSVEMLILDRPNPLGGKPAGTILDMQFSSLVGRYPVPTQHGLTLGEMAKLVNQEWNPHPAKLTVIQCHGWMRNMQWSDTALQWVTTSPNMPNLSTVLHYAGSCLIEGTNLSEGRGTTLPFEIIGAPWIDNHKLAIAINQKFYNKSQYGIVRPHTFIPNASKFKQQVCHGIQLHPYHPRTFNALEAWLHIIDTIRHIYPNQFEWIKTKEDNQPYHFDRLIGIPNFRKADDFVQMLKQNTDLSNYTQLWDKLTLYEIRA